MQLEILIFIQIVAIILGFVAYKTQGTIWWALCVVLFSISAVGYFNIEKNVVVTNQSIVTENLNSTTIDYDYEIITKSSKNIPMVWLSVGMSSICLLFLFLNMFNKGWQD